MKYRSKPTKIDGVTFASKKEAGRYLVLRELEKMDKISDLELQPAFLLQESFIRDKKKYRPIYYIADFRYKENGKTIVEDVKGFKTAEYRLKKKLLLYKYNDFEFKEIK